MLFVVHLINERNRDPDSSVSSISTQKRDAALRPLADSAQPLGERVGVFMNWLLFRWRSRRSLWLHFSAY